MHVIAAKAVALLEAMQPDFASYQRKVIANAREMAKVFVDRGFSIVSSGTDNQLLLLSLIDKDVTGKDADAALGRANITVNKNAVPNDPRPPFVTSGLRLGTPAITARSFGQSETRTLTGWCEILGNLENEVLIPQVHGQVLELCRRHPVYG